jgi:hypothetical protein
MFIGAVPREVVSQILTLVPLEEWGEVFIGCSGSFSVGYAATGQTLPVRFKGELGFMEDALSLAAREDDAQTEDARRSLQIDRTAAVMVAVAMAKYRGNNEYARSHFEHYRTQFAAFWMDARERLVKLLTQIPLASFHAGDFLEQVERAAEADAGFLCFAPTYKGGYERMYRFIDESTEWVRPQYGVWDPSQVGGLVTKLDERGIKYGVLCDQELDGLAPASVFHGGNKPVYVYTSTRAASLRRRRQHAIAFGYKPLEPAALTAETKVEICEIDNKRINFLKDVYLAKGIDHKSGTSNYVVLLDGMLAGGFSFTQQRFGDRTRSIYLLSDFATARERRLSKLIPMLATSRLIASAINRKLMIRIERVETTAFTDKPVSMKYRGIFDLHKREAGFLQYHSRIREQSPEEIYREWFAKHAGRA